MHNMKWCISSMVSIVIYTTLSFTACAETASVVGVVSSNTLVLNINGSIVVATVAGIDNEPVDIKTIGNECHISERQLAILRNNSRDYTSQLYLVGTYINFDIVDTVGGNIFIWTEPLISSLIYFGYTKIDMYSHIPKSNLASIIKMQKHAISSGVGIWSNVNCSNTKK